MASGRTKSKRAGRVTAHDFRRIALGFPEALESAHHGHADFRVGGKVFATMGWPDDDWAMVKVSPEMQDVYVRSKPNGFKRIAGAWGRGGATQVSLKAVDEETLRGAILNAWMNIAPKRLVKAHAV